MRNEANFYPLEADIARGLHRSGLSRPVTVDDAVGMSLEVGEDGYARKIYSTSAAPFSIDSASDACTWLSFPSADAFFVADDRWLDPILKWFGRGIVESYKRCAEGYKMSIGDLRVQYLPDGYVGIHKGGKKIKKVYCLRSFYHMSHMLSEVEDAVSVRDKAQRLIQSLSAYDMPQGNLHTPGSILQAFVVKSGVKCRSNTRIPRAVIDVAANCYHTRLVTAVKLGRFKEAWDYDISSAFPFHTAQLQSCDPLYGEWKKCKEYMGEASYGFCRVRLKYWGMLSPLMFRVHCLSLGFGRRDIHQLNWVGEWEGWLTKSEIDFVRETGIGKVEIVEGWWFMAHTSFLPFHYSMQSFFKARTKAKVLGDAFMKNLCKIVAVAGQGKFMSSFPLSGSLVGGYMRNPMYAAAVTANTRVQVGKFCLEHPDSVLSVMVDGVVLDRKVDVGVKGLEAVEEVGQFRLGSSSAGEECIIAGDGQYWMPSRVSVFQKATLEECASKSSYPNKIVPGRFTLGEVVNGRAEFEVLGKEREKLPEVDLTKYFGYLQRSFLSHPKKCGDFLDHVYDSVPRVLK